MSRILDSVLSLSLYPIANGNKEHYDGILLDKNPVCHTCSNLVCMSTKDLKDFDIRECHSKLLFLKITVFNEKYIMYGLENNFKDLSKNEKKKYSDRIYFKHVDSVKLWKKNAGEIYKEHLQDRQEIEKNDSIFIHDIKKTYSTIYRKIEKYIISHCKTPQDLDQCIRDLDPDILGMYKAINLVDYQFNIIDYISNPESITYGGAKPIKIYKVVDKLVRILQTTSPMKIRLEGYSRNVLYLYDSFIALVFIILDNAIKYSLEGQEVLVSINDVGSDVEIAITSFSPYLDKESKRKIFKKYYRENSDIEGQGIGLYLAQIISEALQASIEINSLGVKTNYNGTDYSMMEFKFFVTNID